MASLHVEADVNWVVELSNQNELLGFQKSLVSRVGSNLCLTNRIRICRGFKSNIIPLKPRTFFIEYFGQMNLTHLEIFCDNLLQIIDHTDNFKMGQMNRTLETN